MEKPFFPILVTPEQVAPLETLKNKQLHITVDYDEIQEIDQFIDIYGKVISQYIKENGIKKLGLEIKTHKHLGIGRPKVVVILKAI